LRGRVTWRLRDNLPAYALTSLLTAVGVLAPILLACLSCLCRPFFLMPSLGPYWQSSSRPHMWFVASWRTYRLQHHPPPAAPLPAGRLAMGCTYLLSCAAATLLPRTAPPLARLHRLICVAFSWVSHHLSCVSFWTKRWTHQDNRRRSRTRKTKQVRQRRIPT